MRSDSSPLLPLLRSRAQGDLLALLYLHPDREYSLTEAAAVIGTSVKTVHTEASRLVASGFVSDRRLGNVRLLRAVTGLPVSRPLTDLLAAARADRPADRCRWHRASVHLRVVGRAISRGTGPGAP